MLVVRVVGQLEQVLAGHLRPQRLGLCLHLGLQLPIVQAQAVLVVGRGRGAVGAVHAVAEQAVQLLDGAFMQAQFLHHLEHDADVQRHHRDGRTGLRHHRFQHRHIRGAAGLPQARVQALRGLVQVHLGAPQCAVPVDRPGDVGADVAEGHRARAVGQHASLVQRIDPQLPVLPAHHGDGVFDLLLGRRLDGGLDDGVLVGVDRGGGVRRADRLQRRALHFAGGGQLAYRRGQRIDHQVHLAAHFRLDQLDHLGARLVGERIAVDRLAVQAGFLRELVERGRVVPARGAGLLLAAGLLEEHAQRVRAETERRADPRRQAVAAGCTDHQHLLRSVVAHALRARGGDLVTHVELAAERMGGGADEAADFGMDDQRRNPGDGVPARHLSAAGAGNEALCMHTPAYGMAPWPARGQRKGGPKPALSSCMPSCHHASPPFASTLLRRL